MKRSAIGLCAHKLLTGLVALSLLLTSTGVSQAQPPGNGDARIYLPLIQEGVQPQTTTIDANTADTVVASAEPGLPASATFRAAPGQALRARHDESTLEIGSAAVAAEIAISITPLNSQHLPPLDQGMTNVTRGPRRGYRFLPHMRFQENIVVSLPYDEKLIPPGMTANDIHTFYYDEVTASWIMLERVAVDAEAKVINSLTDHFTDMINATVAAPEQPQPLSYNPTSMKSVKAADPSTGITLIAPPQANSTGDATLTYPLEVPPGRNGLTPHLAINYNSAAVNGWLGVGWNLASSAITIDTRWGVPRYDEDNETETYTLDGAQLTPVAHRAQLEPRTAEKTFHTRIEGAFRRIVRHGDHPSNYWWEVTDKTGVRYFYGGDPSTGALAPDAILTDASGNVFRWVLREVRDLNGNTIRYAYAHVVDYGQPGGTVEGSQLYLESINYTGSNGAAGPYTITFERTSELGQPRRPDVIIDGRGGFKMVTADLLKRIDVTFNGALVRRYELEYQEGAFRKSLLRSISQFGEDGSLFYTHEFTYYDDIRDGSGAYVGFAEPDGWTTQPDGVTAGLLGFGQASLLGGTINDSVGGHLYLGFNPGAPTKPFSAGGKIGHNRSTSEGVLTLTDVNGDNLPDKVFVQNERIYVRLNESTPGSAPRFSETSHEIASLRDFMSPPQFLKEEAQTTSFGPEAYPGVNIFTNFANTFTTRSIYLSDVNGDGLVDLVNNGQVLFNYLAANGLPTFTPDSNQTGVPVGPGTVDATDLIEDYEELYQQAIDTFPLHDTLRRWVAPFDGNIRISGDVTLIGDTSPARAQYETADGVRVAIQRNGSELWVDTIPATAEDTPVTPTNVDVISVQAGDRIYFRVQSVFDGAFDQVQWDPKIEYLDASAPLDANGLNPYVYQASDDFVMAGRRDIFVQMPITGTVRVTGDLQKLGATTDDVTLLVLKNDVPVVEQTLSWDQTGTIPLDAELPVNQMDILKLRVKVDSPIDLRQIAWVPQITYVSAADPNQVVVDDQGNPIFVIDPPYDIDMYPVNDLTMPQQPWIATETGEATVTTQVTAPSLDTSGTVVFTVKRPSALVAKGTVTINNGVVQNTQLTIDVTAGEPLYFDYSVYDPELRSKLGNADQVRVEFGAQTGTPTVVQAPSVLHSSSAPGLFGQPYRGWAYAGYNGNRDRAEQPIVEADLQQQFNEDSTYDPEQAKAYLFYPFPAENMWRGPDDLGYIQGGVVSSSRLGLDYISVPGEDGFGGARAVKLLSRTSQTAVGGGVLFLSGSVSGEGPLDGGSHSEIDFQDMNGDKYPDIVSKGHIQYTTADGGLEPAKRAVPGMVQPPGSDAFPLISDNEAFNVGIGGSPATFVANGAGEVDSSAVSGPAQNGTGTQMVQLGLSGSLGGGNSRVLANLVDMNGDGLPDRVRQVGNELWVALNLGYSFADEEKWGAGTINVGESDNVSIGASLGFNGGIYDFAGGLSLNKSISYVRRSLLDINGDGLTDQVRQDGNRLLVALNLGGEFTPEFEWRGALSDGFIVNANTGLGAGVYFTIGIGPLCLFACYVIVNPGADASQNMARQEVNLRDVDGDGFVDHVASSVDNVMEVARNRTGRTNLLKSVARPLGASFELSYARDGNTPDLPQSRWVLSKVTVNDGHPGDGVDTLVTTFRYEDGVYSRLEREFFGYGRVVTENRDASNGEALYRAVVQEFRTDSYYTQRLPAREVIQDAAGNIFTEKEYTYLLRDVASGAEPANAQSTTATIFPQAVRVDNRYYEGQATPGKSTFVTNQYDALGNLVQYFDAGDTGVDDDFLSVMAYSADVPACMANHIVATPLALTITGNGSVMRQRQAQIDCTTGKVTQVRQYLENGDVAVTDVSYFANGNLRQITRPANHNGERYQTSYEYDAATQTHVTQITDSFGYVSSATYNLKYGVAASTTDINGQQTTYTFDVFGRMTSVTGPFEQGGSTPTIRFSYHPHAPTPWALTQHLDTYRNPADPIESVLFVDGLGRPLQTKKDITLHTGPDSAPQSVMAVSGRIVFDFLGRIVAQSYPVTETVGSPGVFNNTVDSVAPTRMAYDVMDRNTRITNPDNTFQTVTYGFEANRNGVLHHVRTQTDANGVVKKLYQNVRESLTDLQEFNTVNDSPQTIWTSYEYDPLSQLLSIRDDQDNVTRFVYDNFGRRTVIDSPDAGRIEVTYDLVGNVVSKVTSNLRAENKAIRYDYEFSRLKSITYPNFPGNNVTYVYGEPGAPFNRAGRLVLVTDQSGQEEYFYGPLGEVVKEIKTVASDTGPQPEVYTTEYLYDTWGRLQSLTYPDGEVLTYHYDAGGHIHEISGQKGGVLYPYVKRIEYDKFEERAFMEVANGVRTVFTYDPLDRRLTNLVAGKSGASPFQNLSYTYDNVGNVLSVANQVAVPKAGDFGGPTVQSYTYDDLYRLTGATGLYENSPKRINRYHLTMAYDSIHNIVAKQQVHEIVQPSGSIIEQQKTTYDWSYLYEGAQPHAVTKIGARNFTHDANGNQLGWTHDQNGTRRTIVWDEENRVQSIFDNGHEIRYKYNHQGERVIKRGPQGESVYVNQYFTIRNRELGAKHVYAGTERVVSKLVKQNATEKDQYFYHADHLGGTNYVTDADGKVYEHLEYFPFGETWVQEATDTKRTPYLFTGKELDSETGLYYYGARYYDPQTSRFISTDPLLQQKPDRGVGDPQFYNLYHYSNNNPLHYVDVDGRDVIVVVGSDVRGRYQRLFAATADLFINTVQQANPGLRVHRINVADLQLQQRADGNMETRVQALERRIGEVSRDVRGANNRVSTLVYIGHGTNEGNFLPYLERGEVGDPLSLREASELAQVENQGAVISEACFVGNDISAADQRSLRGRDLRIHATGAEVKFGQDGRVALSPDGRVPPRRSFVNPAEHAIPQLWQPIQLGADPLAQPPPPPTNAQVIRDAEQRTRRP